MSQKERFEVVGALMRREVSLEEADAAIAASLEADGMVAPTWRDVSDRRSVFQLELLAELEEARGGQRTNMQHRALKGLLHPEEVTSAYLAARAGVAYESSGSHLTGKVRAVSSLVMDVRHTREGPETVTVSEELFGERFTKSRGDLGV